MSKPVTCIVIDGYHRGHAVEMQNPPQNLRLIRPHTTTIDDCCDGEIAWETEKGISEYKAAFKSFDGDVILYSTDGSSKEMTKYGGRTNWWHKEGYQDYDEPIMVGIHDPRAIQELNEVKP